MERLLIATTNMGKVKEIRHELEVAGLGKRFEVIGLREMAAEGVACSKCVEDAPTFEGNAMKKAMHFAKIAGCLALADDSGLCVEALNGEPGIFSARYAKVPGSHGDGVADSANNEKLLEKMQNIPDGKRQAKFVCAMALAKPDQPLTTLIDEMHGEMLREHRGTNGFGYDSLFLLPGEGKTTAELDMASKSRVSHRGKALRKMIKWIAEFHSPSAS